MPQEKPSAQALRLFFDYVSFYHDTHPDPDSFTSDDLYAIADAIASAHTACSYKVKCDAIAYARYLADIMLADETPDDDEVTGAERGPTE